MATQCEVIERMYKWIDDARTAASPFNIPPGSSDADYGGALMGRMNAMLEELADYAAQAGCTLVTIDTTPIVPPPSQQ